MENNDIRALQQTATDFLDSHPANYVQPEKELEPGLAGTRLYDAPLIGVASADDPLFQTFKNPDVVGLHHLSPQDWGAEMASVVSLFFPVSAGVRASNKKDFTWPSALWMHARIDGHVAIHATMSRLAEVLSLRGHLAVVPPLDSRYQSGATTTDDPPATLHYTSNWSERHVAYACGLGTFGLSRGLITEKGMAGRFGSLVTTAKLTPTPRPYTRYDEYCTRCGACIPHCPVGAISMENGKQHPPCSDFLDRVEAQNPPYYGCGKCQMAVPCEAGIPPARRT